MEHHIDFIEQHGFGRWVLRECVRANPFYVISAALLGYGAMELNNEMDPEVGKIGGIVLALVVLHVYELAVLGVATLVLRNRRGGGRDLHGLTIVAALFMSGSFLALDELIAIRPWTGAVLTFGTLGLAFAKLEWYARQPGVLLPRAYRTTAMIVLAGHALASVFGAAVASEILSNSRAQELSWACGWISLLPVFWLAWSEQKHVQPDNGNHRPHADPLVTRVCGGTLIGIFALTGISHLVATDWVFDRTADRSWMLPALVILSGTLLVMRWTHVPRFSFGNILLTALPIVALDWLWRHRSPWTLPAEPAMLLALPWQMVFACALVFFLLVRVTRRWEFYVAFAYVLFVPSWARVWMVRGLPFFRGLLMAALGFMTLLGGMVVSLHRDRLLRWLEPLSAKKTEPTEASLP